MAHTFAGNYGEAVAWGRRTVNDNPHFSNGIKQLLIGLGHLRLDEEAAHYVARLMELEPSFCLQEFRKRYPARKPEDLDRLVEGLRLAGVPPGEG